MRSPKAVAERLKITAEALGLTPSEIADRSGIPRNAWSQYTGAGNNARRITIEAAYKLRDEFRLTFDWIYDGDASALPEQLAAKIRKVERSKLEGAA